MMTSKKTYIPELSTWRSIFILMIFFHHVEVYPGGGGLAGVAFFFVLGGFTLTLGYSDKVIESDFNYGRYLKRRLIKFYPLHWLVLFLFVPLLYLCSVAVSVKTFIPNFLLIQSFIPIKDFYYSYNSPSWYLCNTVFFAILFPFIYSNLLRLKGKQWLWVVVLYIVIIIAEYFTPESYWQPILYINPIMRLFDFVLGMLIAMVFKRVVAKDSAIVFLKQKKWLLYVSLFISLSVVIFFSLKDMGVAGNAFSYWLPLFILILSTAFISRISEKNIMTNKVLVSLGGVSFSFYMIHSLIINVVRVIASKTGVTNDGLIIFLTLALTIVGSYFITYCFVNPITKWLTTKLIK